MCCLSEWIRWSAWGRQCTSSLFHRASIQAAMKFKYKPRVIDGQAVEVPGVQNKFTYEIEE